MSLLIDSTLQQTKKDSQLHSYSTVQFRSNKLVLVKNTIDAFKPQRMHDKSIKNLDRKGKTNFIKKATVSRIDKMLTNWLKSISYENEVRARACMRAERQPVFLTLTLSAQQIHPDQVIKREMLMPFIQDLKRNFGVRYYFWKAELQQNYNIHFHLVIDQYVDRFRIQEVWNKHQEKKGYITRFAEKHGHRNPPSTDVRAIKDMKMMTSYLTKYVCKSADGAWIDGQLWNASKALKEMSSVTFDADNHFFSIIDLLLQEDKLELYEQDFFAVLRFTKKFDFRTDYKYFASIERYKYLEVYHYLYETVAPALKPVDPEPTKPAKVPVQQVLDLDVEKITGFEYFDR